MIRAVIPIALAFTIIAGGSIATAETYMDSGRIACVAQAQEYLFSDRFTLVDSIYTARIETDPADPMGHLFRAGALFAEMSDREENLHEELFLGLLKTTDSLTREVIDTCDDRTAAWMYLFRGHAKAYQSLWESKFGSMMKALRLGLSTIDEYEAGLKHDSTLYDLYAGTGSYHYWKSAKAGVLKYIGIFKDEKDKGIAELRLAADSSLLHRDLARSALIWIWLDRKEFDSAIVLAHEFADRYPEGKAFRWPLAQALYQIEDYRRASETYLDLRRRLEADPGNYFNMIQCDYYLAHCFTWLEQPDEAIRIARRLQEYEAMIPRDVLGRQKAKLNYLRRLSRRRLP